jgi:hypothetical protein
VLFAGLTLAFGVIALGMWRYVTRTVRRARGWPTVPGTILERGIGPPMGMGRSVLPLVRYAYEVDGAGYAGDQVYLIRRTGNLRPVVQRLVDGLPDPVPVHYDPADPASSYLVVNPPSTARILLLFGIGAVLLALMQAVVALG